MNLFPKNPKFFNVFEELAETAEKASLSLADLHKNRKKTTAIANTVRKLELHADTLCHTLMREAESTFITPIDREDIHLLARNLDSVIDYTEDLSAKITLYNGVFTPTSLYKELTSIIVKSTTSLKHLVRLLKHKNRYAKDMKKHIIAIHTLEEKGDECFRRALSALFREQKNAVVLIQWKDLYETAEKILDECERTADTIETIIIKNF